MYVAAVFLPLLGSLIAGILVFIKGGDKDAQGRIDLAAQLVTCGAMVLAALAALLVFTEVVGAAAKLVEALRS